MRPTICRDAADVLDEVAAIDASTCGQRPLDRARLLELPAARARNLLRREIRRLGGHAPSRLRLGEALRQLRETGDRPLRVALGDVALCAYRGAVQVEAVAQATPPRAVAWRGEAALPWGDERIRFEPVVGAGLSRAKLEQATDVVLTTRWPGLTFREGSGRPRRTFKKLCQEAGVPAWLRDRLPVLQVDGEAAWIGDLGVALEFRAERGEPGLMPRRLR